MQYLLKYFKRSRSHVKYGTISMDNTENKTLLGDYLLRSLIYMIYYIFVILIDLNFN